MSRIWWWTRLMGGAAIVAVVVWRAGTGPIFDGVRMIDAKALAAGVLIGVPTTVCCAWRWSLVGRALGAPIPLRTAVTAYYRSQFLNTVLPGGVLGDVHRGVRHGRDLGDAGRGLRAVAWERLAGQVVQLAMAMLVLLLLPSPVRSSIPTVGAAVVAVVLVVLLLVRALPLGGTSMGARTLSATRSDFHEGLLARRVWPGVALVSGVALLGHVVTFLVAARTAGSTASPAQMLPLALLVLLAMGLPMNVAGWGPREGVAATAFGAAGLGADQGVATAVVYGVMVFVAYLPGAAVLIGTWLRPNSLVPDGTGRLRAAPHRAPPRAMAGLEGRSCG